MNSYAARAVHPCTVPYNIKLHTVLHAALADYRVRTRMHEVTTSTTRLPHARAARRRRPARDLP